MKNSSSTTTPIVPEWGSSVVQGAAGRIGGLLGRDPQSWVAPANPLQQQAAAGAARLGQTPAFGPSAGGFGEAAGIVRDVAGASAGANTYDPQAYDATTYGGARIGPVAGASTGSLLTGLDNYMSPYRRDVVDAALADYDHGAGQTLAQQDLDLAGSGAFGGSGAALTRSMTADNLVRGRATTSANLLDQMFNRGAALSNLDADRRTQVSMTNAGAVNTAGLNQAQLSQEAGLARSQALNDASRYRADTHNEAGRFNAGQADGAANRRLEAGRNLADIADADATNQRAWNADQRDWGASDRADIANQLQVGDTLRGIDNEARQAPITSAGQIVGMLNGLPLGLFSGQETTGTETTVSKGKNVSVSAGITG